MAASSDASFAVIRAKPLSQWKGLASAQSALGAMNTLEKIPGLSEIAVFGGGLHVTAANADHAVPEIRSALESAGISAPLIEPIQPSMEDVFVAMIEQEDKKAA